MTAVARYTNSICKMFLICIKLKVVINWVNLMKKSSVRKHVEKKIPYEMENIPRENQNIHKKSEASWLSGQKIPLTRTLTHFQKYYDLFH